VELVGWEAVLGNGAVALVEGGKVQEVVQVGKAV